MNTDLCIHPGRKCDPYGAIDCHGQDESVVIISVLADEVYTSRRADDKFRFGVKMNGEGLFEGLGVHGCFYTIEAM